MSLPEETSSEPEGYPEPTDSLSFSDAGVPPDSEDLLIEDEQPISEVDELNPFSGNQSVEQQRSRLELGGGGILPLSGVTTPEAEGGAEGAASEARPHGDVENDVQRAAQKACGLIAAMFIEEGNPDTIPFPVCSDTSVIDSALQQLGNTPLGLGYGNFPEQVPQAWARFVRETTDHYRREKGLGPADLAPLVITLPEWLKASPSFDILEDCTLMNIVISGDVGSVIGKRLTNSRVKFNGKILPEARVGDESQRCTVVMAKDMSASMSFKDAANVSLTIEGHHSNGRLGPISNSKIVCDGNWQGFVEDRGGKCLVSKNVTKRTLT